MNQHSITHPYVGMWVTKDGHIRQELLPDGRYDEARGKRKSAYTGSYSVKGNRIDYVDDTGFTADGEFRDDVLYHGGMTFTGRKKMYNNISKKVVAITGASSGIGEAAARLLAANGAHVVLGARRRDRLEAAVKAIRAEGGSAEYQALDVTSREQMEAFIGFAKDKFGHVDVIVNNAGVMPLSKLEALKVDEWDRMIDVNIRGVLHGIAAGLPIMQKQGFGQFINVASIGAYGVVPTAAVYSATKYAVRAITDGLRQEVGNGIRVTLVSPGVTESELADHISDEEARQQMKEYRRISISAAAVARTILFAMEQPEEVDVNEIIVRPTASSN